MEGCGPKHTTHPERDPAHSVFSLVGMFG